MQINLFLIYRLPATGYRLLLLWNDLNSIVVLNQVRSGGDDALARLQAVGDGYGIAQGFAEFEIASSGYGPAALLFNHKYRVRVFRVAGFDDGV